MDIEVMYSDGSRQRVPVANAATLRRDEVLFMILSAETTEAKARIYIDGKPYRRAREIFGLDYYAVLTQDGYHLLWGWDDHTYAWVDTTDPFVDYSVPDPRNLSYDTYRSWPPWLPQSALIFVGGYLSPDKWEKARVVFKDMH